jgi:3-oxoacyl-[acyl-carrier-protein] synthase III
MSQLLRGAVVGTGSYAPAKVLSNLDLMKLVDTSDEWIVQRTGVRERRIVSEGETPASMGIAAARSALENAGMTADQLDLIVCGTISPDMIFPATACLIQDGLGISEIPCFDVSAACSGFIYALTVADSMIATGNYKNVLVVASDALTRFTDYTDRGSCILFGDAAGAVVLRATEDRTKGLQYSNLGARGSGWDFIHVPAGGSRLPATSQTVADKMHYIRMRGRDVYKFAVQRMVELMADGMAKCGLKVEDVDLVVPHQVNQRIIESATSKLEFPLEKVFVNIDRFGNTSGASIPLALDQAHRAGRTPPGSTLLLVAFGAGLTWGASVLKM